MDESNDAWNAQASGSSSRPETPSGRNNPHPLASNTILRISHIEGDIRSEDVGSATFPVSRQRQKRVSGADAAKRWNYADDGKAIIDRPHYRSRELLQAYGAAALPIDRRVPEVRPNGVAKSKTPIAVTFARNAEVEVGLNCGLPVALDELAHNIAAPPIPAAAASPPPPPNPKREKKWEQYKGSLGRAKGKTAALLKSALSRSGPKKPDNTAQQPVADTNVLLNGFSQRSTFTPFAAAMNTVMEYKMAKYGTENPQ
jgi:hypothetical protein